MYKRQILLLPGGGDELQGIKKGILELADAILINKADGESENLANKTRLHYQSALSLLTQSGFWSPEVRMCSALERSGIAEAWDMVRRFHDEALAAGQLASIRSEQNLQWMWQLTDQLLREASEALRAKGIAIETKLCDVSKADEIDALADLALSKFGQVNVVCSCLLYTSPSPRD